MKTFAVIHNIPSPYRIHLFAALHHELACRGIELHIHFMASGHEGRPTSWLNPEISFLHTFWPDCGPCVGKSKLHLNPRLLLHLRQRPAPDILLVGGAWCTLTGILASVLSPRHAGIVWIETNTKTPGRLRGWVGAFKRFILRRYDYVAVPGQEGKDYLDLLLREHGAPRPVPVVLPNLVDETRFKPRSGHRAEDLLAVRRELGVGSEDRVAICPARLAPVKGIQEFLSCIGPETLGDWRIVILGEGPLASAIADQIKRVGYAGRVLLRNYVSYDKMPAAYAAADLFLLPSLYDPNPLSVVEAMHSGLPLLLSDRVGNFPEALEEAVNGWSFNPGDLETVRRAAACAFSATRQQLVDMGEQSRLRAGRFWNTPQAVRSFLDAVGAV